MIAEDIYTPSSLYKTSTFYSILHKGGNCVTNNLVISLMRTCTWYKATYLSLHYSPPTILQQVSVCIAPLVIPMYTYIFIMLKYHMDDMGAPFALQVLFYGNPQKACKARFSSMFLYGWTNMRVAGDLRRHDAHVTFVLRSCVTKKYD